MSQPVWDAAIIGGGPAGCAAALALLGAGWRVVVLEAKTYPHDKMCGEFISPEGVSLLADLGLEARLRARGPVSIKRTRITAPSGAVWDSSLPGTALGISRAVLDQEMAEAVRAAGGEVREAAPVMALRGSLADGFWLRAGGQAGELRARAVIGAHGKRATVDRLLNRNFLNRPSPYVAVKAHYHGPPIPGRIELHAFPGGYCGLSEIEDDRRVVCLLAREAVFRGQHGPRGVDDFIRWMRAQNPALEAWLGQAERIHERWITIAQVHFGPKPAIEGDVLLAGDAAGLIVPLAGDGISMALDGGLLAAGWLDRWLSGKIPPEELRGGYQRAWHRRFAARLRLGRALQPLMLHPAAARVVLQLLKTAPALGTLLIRQTRGALPAGSSLETGRPIKAKPAASERHEMKGRE